MLHLPLQSMLKSAYCTSLPPKEMHLWTTAVICLAIVLPLAVTQDSQADKLSCDNEDVKTLILERHNEIRSNVKPSPVNMLKLEWSHEAAAKAKEWALKCKHEHSKAPAREISSCGCGENLYMSNRPHSWRKAIQAWYDEVKDFKHGEGPTKPDAVTGHYTQLVWYKTYLLGCALAFCPNQALPYYYVCHYCPSGNSRSGLLAPYMAGESCANCTHACVNGLCTNPCLHNNEYENCNEYEEFCNTDEEDLIFIKHMCRATCNCKKEIK
ncbi:cysteine-rich secretory protein 2 [Pelodytes ibericus]